MTIYDASTEFESLTVPDDPQKDSKTKALARFRKLVDPLTNPAATASSSPAARFGAIVDETLRREAEADRKADIDPIEALEQADPHGLIPTEQRRHILERRGFDATGV